MSAVDAYMALLHELLQAREDAGGELPESAEVDFSERLDTIWHTLTAEEQDQAEWLQFTALPKRMLIYSVEFEIARAKKDGGST